MKLFHKKCTDHQFLPNLKQTLKQILNSVTHSDRKLLQHSKYYIITQVLLTRIRIMISDSIRRNIRRIGIVFTRTWIDFMSCSHVTGCNSYPDKLSAYRPCVHTYPSLSYWNRLFTRISALSFINIRTYSKF